MVIRTLTAPHEFRRVVDLECEVWRLPDAADAVSAILLTATTKRGAILIGAFDGERMVGFVYSFPGLRQRRTMQWSHMLGVVDAYRNSGVGRLLKVEQRRVALEMGMDLIEWTYDPLQAVNAHLNFRRLGVQVEEYELEVYGDSASPLHQGTPTDRFVAQWWIRSRRVACALGEADAPARLEDDAVQPRGTSGPRRTPCVNEALPGGTWLTPGTPDLTRSDPEVLVAIPTGFTEMQAEAPELARAWRLATRKVFTSYLGRGYVVVDFSLDRDVGRGHYLLARRSGAGDQRLA
jgi:predicted GNAT superfamily acetyltransferase